MSMHHKLFTLRRRRVVCFVWPSLNIKWPSFLIAAWVTLKHSQEFKNKFLFSRNFTGRSSKSIQPVCRNLKGYRSMHEATLRKYKKKHYSCSYGFYEKKRKICFYIPFPSLIFVSVCLFASSRCCFVTKKSWMGKRHDVWRLSHIAHSQRCVLKPGRQS